MLTTKKIILFICAMIMVVGLVGCQSKTEETKEIHIGHKNYTEQRIVGQLYAVMIENNTDYATKVTEFGGTQLVLEALKNDEVDFYGEYTGTLYATVLNAAGETNPEKVYDEVKSHMETEYAFSISNPIGFNNTYTLSVPQEVAAKYNLEKISDLTDVASELRLGAAMEFLERADGLPGVKEVYGIDFKSETGLDPGIRYTAVENGDVDIIDAFSTDGKILQYNLKVLKDDKEFFPPYYMVTMLNGEFAKAYPDVAEVLKKLEGQISDDEMQKMNFLVDKEGLPEKKVAEDFLREKGLIE